MTENFQFKDPNLESVIQRYTPQFKTFQKNLDDTSSDIKTLEKWLQSNGICFRTSVSIDRNTSLVWSKSSGDWRLMLRCPPPEYEIEEDDDDETFCRPLIELPVKTRVEARNYLPLLIEEIAKLVVKSAIEPAKIKASVEKENPSAQASKDGDIFASFGIDEIPF